MNEHWSIARGRLANLPTRALQSGETLVGFIIGLVVGLAIAVAVAVYITNAPLPFVNKVQRPTTQASPGTGPLPDPNKPLYAPVKSEAPAKAEAPVAKKADVPPPAAEKVAEKPAETAAAKSATPVEEGTRFLLQAGAFKSPDEADGMRARLGMLGLDARIFPIEQSGQTLYRVRLGPYGQLDEINKTRKLLAENGIDAQVVRLK